MKISTGRIILSDRLIFAALSAVIAVAVSSFVIFLSSGKTERENKNLQSQLQEMHTLKKDLIRYRVIVESQEKKIGLKKAGGVVPALEGILDNLGIQAKMIKPLEKKKIREFEEEAAELQIDDINLNKIVNLFYKIENSALPLKIKGAAFRTGFENPNAFTLTMTVSLIGLPR